MFRLSAKQSIARYSRLERAQVTPADTKDTSAYALLSQWAIRLDADTEAISAARTAKPLHATLAQYLHMPNKVAVDLAERLVTERLAELYDMFLDTRYDSGSKARKAAYALLTLPTDQLTDIYQRFMDYYIHQQVAHDLGITLYDEYSPFLRRLHQKRAERRQVTRYQVQQSRRLDAINTRQRTLKTERNALVARILSLDLDTVLVLDAYRTYAKRLEALKPASRTPNKRLDLFAAATKKIRESYTNKQSPSDKLADLQQALKVVDEVLVELFDMTDTQRNKLMTRLKEYRDLDREAARITKEQTTWLNSAE